LAVAKAFKQDMALKDTFFLIHLQLKAYQKRILRGGGVRKKK